jgi:hypothetical protein
MKKFLLIFFGLFLLIGCDIEPTSNQIEAHKQEQELQEMAKQVGMPAISNFREKRILKMVLEMRDQNITTYTYSYSDYNGKFRFIGNSIGFPISAATQYTNPQKVERMYQGVYVTLPQADPNGLFSPASAEGSYLLMQDPSTKELKVCYFETRVNTLPFKLPDSVVFQ